MSFSTSPAIISLTSYAFLDPSIETKRIDVAGTSIKYVGCESKPNLFTGIYGNRSKPVGGMLAVNWARHNKLRPLSVDTLIAEPGFRKHREPMTPTEMVKSGLLHTDTIILSLKKELLTMCRFLVDARLGSDEARSLDGMKLTTLLVKHSWLVPLIIEHLELTTFIHPAHTGFDLVGQPRTLMVATVDIDKVGIVGSEVRYAPQYKVVQLKQVIEHRLAA